MKLSPHTCAETGNLLHITCYLANSLRNNLTPITGKFPKSNHPPIDPITCNNQILPHPPLTQLWLLFVWEDFRIPENTTEPWQLS